MKEIENFNEIFNELSSFASKQELLFAFGSDYFKATSFQNLNSTKIADSLVITNFLGVSFPIGERIFKCLTTKAAVDFIIIDEFLYMLKIFFCGDMKVMASFFFKLVDFDENSIIIDALFQFFSHINFASKINKTEPNQFIEDFFGSKESMTYEEYLTRIEDNPDVVLLFYYYVFHMKCFNDEVINYYEKNLYEIKGKERIEVERKVRSNKCLIEPLMRHSPTKERKYSNKAIDFKEKRFNLMSSTEGKIDGGSNKVHKDYHCSRRLVAYLNRYYRLNNSLVNLNCNQRNSLKTSNTEQYRPEQDDDIELLNEFEKDKMASFDHLANVSHMIHKERYNCISSKSISQMISINDNGDQGSNYDNEINNNSEQDYNGLISNKDKEKGKDDNDDRSSIEKKKTSPYPYRIYNQKTKMGCMSDQIALNDKPFSLLNLSFTVDKIKEDKENKPQPRSASSSVSSSLEFTNVTYSSFIKSRLILISNFLFILFDSNEKKYRILLLKNSFITKTSEKSVVIHSPQDNNHQLTFHDKDKLELFIIYFNTLNRVRALETKYEIVEEIGHGHFGTITKAKSKSDPMKEYCIKTIPKDKNPYLKLAKWEAYIASYLSQYPHTNIIRFYEVYETTRQVYIVMEYFYSKTINDDDLSEITNEQSNRIMKQLVDSVDYLHSNGIIHRDLKLDNILYSKGLNQIKVIDFGLSKVLFPSESTGEFCGTLSFTAPEVIMRQKYDFSADIWSIGIIAYIFEFKEHPYNIDKVKIDQMIIEINHLLAKLLIENCDWKETLMRTIVKNCLIKKPKERYNGKQLLNLFNDLIEK